MLQPHRITVKLGRSVGITHDVPCHDPDRPIEYVHLRSCRLWQCARPWGKTTVGTTLVNLALVL